MHALPAWSQAAAPAAPASPASSAVPTEKQGDRAAVKAEKLEVVTVTATRRREPLRDVPLRVETISTEGLERSGAGSLVDYVGNLPGVDVSSDGGPGRGQVSIRGINVGSAGTATVGTYVDEVAYGSSTAFGGAAVAALDMSLLDLHHIELLRGPQGTLYGAGAMGGLLKYVTNEPDTLEFSGKVGLGVRGIKGGALGHTENAVVNVPLSAGVAALRVAAFNDHDGGYIKRLRPGARQARQRRRHARRTGLAAAGADVDDEGPPLRGRPEDRARRHRRGPVRRRDGKADPRRPDP